jgi:anti-sigma regulatory factor (Ser/Thr protein kinase)
VSRDTVSQPPSAGHEFRQEIPANLAAIEDFCLGVRRWALSLQLPNRFAVELITREALTNAAVHGCGCDSSKQVTCVLRLRSGRVIIAVHDQGRGFDWRAVWARMPANDACCGRGMGIIRQYAHRLRFNRRGNSLIIIKRLTREGTR